MAVEETSQQREAKAVQLAEARGRRQQEVDGRLDEADRRFERINGSIDRAAEAQEKAETRLAGVERKVDEVIAKMRTAEEVSGALAKASVSHREFWLGVAAVVVVLVGALLQGAHL